MSAGSPLSYLDGAGSQSARSLEQLAWGFSAISIAVVLIIAVLIAFAIRRSRTLTGQAERSEIARMEGGLRLIWWGVGLSVPVLIGMAVWNFLVSRALATAPSAFGLTVEVTAHRWWWEVRYDDPSGPPVKSANEVVIPVGVPVRFKLASADVIHDFWIPKLGPKMDMIPGRTNETWLKADLPGLYRGQCAEYCGLEHARMSFVVKAVSLRDYGTWLAGQRLPAVGTAFPQQHSPGPLAQSAKPASSALAAADTPGLNPMQYLFVNRCGVCHTVRGTEAGGIMGPDLTHFASRATLAGGMLANTPYNLDRWLQDPQAVKPGVLMPKVPLDPAQRHQLDDFLGGLR